MQGCLSEWSNGVRESHGIAAKILCAIEKPRLEAANVKRPLARGFFPWGKDFFERGLSGTSPVSKRNALASGSTHRKCLKNGGIR